MTDEIKPPLGTTSDRPQPDMDRSDPAFAAPEPKPLTPAEVIKARFARLRELTDNPSGSEVRAEQDRLFWEAMEQLCLDVSRIADASETAAMYAGDHYMLARNAG